MGNNSIQTSWSRRTSDLGSADPSPQPATSTPAPTAEVSRPQHLSDADWQRIWDDLPERHIDIPTHIPKMDPQAERIEEAKRAAEAKPKAQLDTVRDRFSGPYKVKGEKASVPARPQFRINVAIAKSTTDELVKICTKAGIPKGTINNACMGRPTGQQLVRVTQALIDAGKLPAADATLNTTEKRIRQMQHNWGIGVDCAGYVREAAIAVHGNGAQSLVNGENRYGAIYSLLKTNAFKKVAVADPKTHKIRDIRDIRTGDIIHLDSPGGGVVGHNVIVHSHEIATDAIRYELSAREVSPPHELRSFLNRNGPIHVLNVDSSWGVDKGGIDQGGFRRDTWLYDESSGEWGSIIPRSLPDTPIFLQSQDGPYEHIFKGAFRPTSAK